MVPLFVLRHGPTAWTEAKRLQGQTDIPLSRLGRAQVRGWRLPMHVIPFDWWVSPLRRTIETAALLGLPNFAVEDRLIEMNWGFWEGRRQDDLRRKFGEIMVANESRGLDFRALNGERPRDVLNRLQPWLHGLAVKRRPTAAVAHKGVLNVLTAMATDWDLVGPPPFKARWGHIYGFRVWPGGRIAYTGEIRLEPHK